MLHKIVGNAAASPATSETRPFPFLEFPCMFFFLDNNYIFIQLNTIFLAAVKSVVFISERDKILLINEGSEEERLLYSIDTLRWQLQQQNCGIAFYHLL